MIYEWKTGARIKTSPQTAGEICASLEAQGRLTARELLDASRPEHAPLHGEFTWDDGVAAEKWREGEAGHIIRCLVTRAESDADAVRAFFTIERTENTYTSVETILQREDTAAKLRNQALEELRAFERKYNGIVEFAKLFAEINKIREAP